MFGFEIGEKLMYAFRGWIAFVAFMDLGTAFRCFIDKRTFLDDVIVVGANATNQAAAGDQDPALTRIIGAYAIMKAVILIHCALFIHYRPLISLTIFSLILTLMVHLTECFIFQTAPFGFYVIFPGLLNIITMIGLSLAPRYLHKVDELVKSCSEDENVELLRQAGAMRRKRHNRKNQ
ncbi:ergosterol biosynthetic protein 28 homolog [Neocloeon triangulifer]|uniref:ergosterol biosynthetic protein 28 homolog n=1 Tax=Neocloeon triangulifer TaxID=2078957 RepID=UPI00286ED743|nr:ergosterol biosynthetic protein 28 homolog [Neocloeon triangulifer]